MTRNEAEVLTHWNTEIVESMYDKHLLNAEIGLILAQLRPGSKILDAGCGEGEGTLAYSGVEGATVVGADYSETRLKKAAERVAGRPNVRLQQVDFLGPYALDDEFDFVVSQRFLINLMEWRLQSGVLLDLMRRLKKGGRLVMLEGSRPGVDELNRLRAAWNLPPIPVRWHNLFFDDAVLTGFMTEHGFTLRAHDGLGAYFALTRGIRPVLDPGVEWDCDYNRLAAGKGMEDVLGLGTRFSRLKLWVFEK